MGAPPKAAAAAAAGVEWLARSRPRKRLTVVTKSNAQRHAMVMWDEIAAEVMGIDRTRTKLAALTLGAGFAGVAGVLFAARTTFVNPASFTFLESAMVLAIVVLALLGLGGCVAGNYNSLVAKKAEVENKWAQVDNQLQRRGDLIGNLDSGSGGRRSLRFLDGTLGRRLGLADDFAAFRALHAARRTRGTLDLDLEERKVELGPDGLVARIAPRSMVSFSFSRPQLWP